MRSAIDRNEIAGNIPIRLDVVSAYTSVPVPEAIATVDSYVTEYDTDRHGLSDRDITELLDIEHSNSLTSIRRNIFE